MIFSSVGDNTDFCSLWIGDNMDYDVYVVYYGDDEGLFNAYKSKVTMAEKRKGAKFQNFKYFYETYPDIINKYDRFFIVDDDIIINVDDINAMFNISIKYDLDICGPSFSNHGKISHPITVHKHNILLTYTNFVEVNVPLFSKFALNKFMKMLDYKLIGWGIDYLFVWCNGPNRTNAYAIIHCIICKNPYEIQKKYKLYRENESVENFDSEQIIWVNYANKINCPVRFDTIEYGSLMTLSSAIAL